MPAGLGLPPAAGRRSRSSLAAAGSFGAARSRKLMTDPDLSVLRRPQPAEGETVYVEDLGLGAHPRQPLRQMNSALMDAAEEAADDALLDAEVSAIQLRSLSILKTLSHKGFVTGEPRPKPHQFVADLGPDALGGPTPTGGMQVFDGGSQPQQEQSKQEVAAYDAATSALYKKPPPPRARSAMAVMMTPPDKVKHSRSALPGGQAGRAGRRTTVDGVHAHLPAARNGRRSAPPDRSFDLFSGDSLHASSIGPGGSLSGGNSSISVGPGGRALNSSVVDYLNPARRTDRGVEQVHVHHPVRRHVTKDGGHFPDPSVPLDIESLQQQEYVMTTDGLVTKTGTGHNEFNAMPDWLQESAYNKWKSRFHLFLWGVLCKFRSNCSKQKFARTRKIFHDRQLIFRPTFMKPLLAIQSNCANIAAPPSRKLLQTRRLARYGEKEVVKHMQEQRIAAHELFVETVEQSCRVVERVISEVQVQELHAKATSIKKAKAEETHRWKRHPKDAAKIKPGPSYGPNNRLNPKPAARSTLHAEPDEVLDAELLGNFIRLCDFYTVYAVMFQLQAHLDNFTRDLTLGASRRLEYLETSATFKIPAELEARRLAKAALGGMGAELAPSPDGSWTPVYFEPSVATYQDIITDGFREMVVAFEAPRVLFYEPFKPHLKSVISFGEMQQVLQVDELLPPGYLEGRMDAVCDVLDDSYAVARKETMAVFEGMDEFHLFANSKIEAMQAAEAIDDVKHIPSSLRMCHQWRKTVAAFETRRQGIDASAGVMFIEGARMYEELQQLVQDIFHEGQYTLERVIDNVGMAEVEVVVGFKELLQAGHHEAVECRDALAAARRPGRTAFDEMPIEEIEAHAREAAGQVQGLLQEGWDVLEAAKAKLEALAQLVAWLQKPAQWLPGQVTSMTARPTDPRKEKAKATLWGGSASTLAKGMAYAKKENKMLAALDEADEQTTYRVQLATSEAAGAGTDATVRIELIGAKRSSGVIMLNSGQEGRFVTGSTEQFEIGPMVRLRGLKEVVVAQDGTGFGSSWMLDEVEIHDQASGEHWICPCCRWIEDDVQETLPAVRTEGGSFGGRSPKGKGGSSPHGFNLMAGMLGGGRKKTPAAAIKPGLKLGGKQKALLRKKSWAAPKVLRKNLREFEALVVAVADDLKKHRPKRGANGMLLDVEVATTT